MWPDEEVEAEGGGQAPYVPHPDHCILGAPLLVYDDGEELVSQRMFLIQTFRGHRVRCDRPEPTNPPVGTMLHVSRRTPMELFPYVAELYAASHGDEDMQRRALDALAVRRAKVKAPGPAFARTVDA